MASFSVTVSKFETMTLRVEAEDMQAAEDQALEEAQECWEAETVGWQVDGASLITEPATTNGRVLSLVGGTDSEGQD